MEDILKIPNETRMEEKNIVVGGDVLIGNYADVGYGIIGKSVVIGEGATIFGDIIADESVIIDLLTDVEGDVRTKKDAYLGESVKVHGKLTVGGDLDIGRNVSIDEGLEAKGWIVIRNPIPIIVYILIYLAELLKLGKGEEIERFLSDEEREDDDMMIIPDDAKIADGTIFTRREATIGDDCRIIGNITTDSLNIGENSTIFGSIRTKKDVYIGKNSTIHGDLISNGKVHVEGHILGGIDAHLVSIHEDAEIDGKIKANSVSIVK